MIIDRFIKHSVSYALLMWAAATTAHAGFAGFAGPMFFDVVEEPESVALGDLDGDGDLDLAAVNNEDDSVSVLLNDGDGVFGPQMAYAVGSPKAQSFPKNVTIGSLDGDGSPDLAVAHNQGVAVLINNGDGTFQPQVIYPAELGPRRAALADLDNDGDTDMAVCNGISDTVSVFLNNGDGTFASQMIVDTGDGPEFIDAADMDGDGDVDLVTSNTEPDVGGFLDTIAVLENTGGAAFAAPDFFQVGPDPQEVRLGDFDNDGDIDAATTNSDTGDVSILLNNGDATFPPKTFVSTGNNTRSLTLADLDLDGDLDIVAADSGDDALSILLNDGSGTFAVDSTVSAGDAPQSVASGDLDNDGDPDLAAGNFNTDQVAVLLNNNTVIGGPPPVADISAPDELTCVCDTVEIRGEADVPGGVFGSFLVEVRRIQPSPEPAWTTIATGNTAIPGPKGLIATWDTSGFTEGRYLIRLTAENAGGLSANDVVAVWVSQDFNTLNFFVSDGRIDDPGPTEIAGGNVCPYGTINDNACGPDEYMVEFAPAGTSDFQPVDPANPIYSGDRFNETLAEWDTQDLGIADGDYVVRVTAMNGCDDSAEQTQEVTIDNTSPIATIDSPVNCDRFEIGDVITITGEIFDENLAGWTLQYTGGDTNGWNTIASGNTNVDGVIAEWDTSGLPSCAYTLRLRASDQATVNCTPSGHSSGTLVSINVGCVGDLNGDGQVDGADLGVLLGAWGSCF